MLYQLSYFRTEGGWYHGCSDVAIVQVLYIRRFAGKPSILLLKLGVLKSEREFSSAGVVVAYCCGVPSASTLLNKEMVAGG